jgi:WD40 repeat protein
MMATKSKPWAALALAVSLLLAQFSPEPGASAAGPPARVDRYGDPLPPGALARLGTTRFRAGYVIFALAFTPDGKGLVAASAGRPPCLYEMATGKVLRHFGNQTYVRSIAISPDGKTLAVEGNSVRLYSLATGKQVGELKDPNAMGPVGLCVSFSPDGKMLASGARDHSIRLWDVAGARELRRCQGHTQDVTSLAFGPAGKTLASGSGDHTVRLWDAATGKVRQVLRGHHQYIFSLAFTPDSKTLASAGDDKTVRLWNVETGKPVGILKGHEGVVRSVAFSPDGRVLASGGGDKAIRIWRMATAKEIGRLTEGISGLVSSVAFSPDGKTLASTGGFDSSIHFWDVATGQPCHRFGGHTGTITALSFSADGRSLTSAACDGWVYFWDARTGRERRRVGQTHDRVPHPFAFASDQKTFASAGFQDNSVRLGDLATGKELRSFGKHKEQVRALTFLPDGKVLATGDGQLIHLWDTATGKEIRSLKGHKGYISCLAFSPDGKVLASGGMSVNVLVDDHAVRLWEVATGKEIRELETSESPALAFSPDGKVLASGDTANTIRVWQVATGREIAKFRRYPANPRAFGSYIYWLTFSPDGRTLASGWGDTPVILWEAATGKEIRRLLGHQSSSGPVLFSPDGRTLASGSGDSSILIWDLTRHIRDGRLEPLSLSPHELAARWSDLANPNAGKADRAVWDLVAAAEQSMPFLKNHFRPVVPIAPRQVAPLIADLDSQRFAVRRKATRALEQLGERAEPALRARLATNPPLETRQRIDRLLRQMSAMGGEHLRAVRVLTVLERAGGSEARALLTELAQGEPDMWRTREARAALKRMDQRR